MTKKKKAAEEAEEILKEQEPVPQEEPETEEPTGEAEAAEPERDPIAEAEAKAAEYLSHAQRLQAEFDNYRKRNVSAMADSRDEGTRQALAAMLPVLDNLERALAAEAEDTPFKQGVDMILRQMQDAMAGLGLEAVDTGIPFDPNVHHAVMQCEADDEHPAGTIVNVFQKGYTARGRVIRAAMVQVAQ